MSQARIILVAAALALALGACNKSGPEVAGEETAAAPGETGADGTPADAAPATPSPSTEKVEPVAVSGNAVLVGSARGADGAATAPKPTYAVGDTVYASARGNGPARVYWTYQDGNSHKEEEKPANGIVTFQFDAASGMKAGNYTVQVDINDTPVGITDFVVK